jgi:catechol 2,3-dioxygenase-like lactoylglutathione lyase family enzyme
MTIEIDHIGLSVSDFETAKKFYAAALALLRMSVIMESAEADRIRAELDGMGIALKDAKDPATGELVTTWEVKR